MDAIEPNMLGLARFGVLSAISCIALFILAGMFPLSVRPQPAKAPGGLLLIGGNMAALLFLMAGTALYGWGELRWTTLIIGSGTIFLFAPGLLQALPAQWRDGRPGLTALLLIQLAGLFLLYGKSNLI